jgi:hypothetical protein
LLNAIAAKPKFSGQLRRWPRTRLPDLAFAIDTRVTYLPQITEAANEHLEALGHDIAADWGRFTVCVADGGAFPFTNRKALNGALMVASSFIAESRACFENLAEFYREFSAQYFASHVDKPASYDAIGKMARRRGWVRILGAKRHDVLHSRSLWLAFEYHEHRQQMFEPLFLLNWRPGSYRPKDTVRMKDLREIRVRLVEAAFRMRDGLIHRVKAASRRVQ